MAAQEPVVVLGGGVGGLIAARALRKRLGREQRIVLVDREREHLFAPSLLWLMVGQRKAQNIKRPLQRLEARGIEVRLGEVEKLEPETRVVTVAGHALGASHLIVALGAELAPELIPGLAEAGHNLYTEAGAQAIYAALQSLHGGRVVVLTATPAYKCPAAPYEAALLLESYLRRHGKRGASTVEVYAAEPAPLGVAGPEMSQAVVQLLAAKGIPYHPQHQVQSVDAKARRLEFANGARADFDLLVYIPPHRAPRVVRDSALAGETGWVSVDRHTLETRFANVYALGDVVSIPLALGKPLPKAGVFAHGEAEVVAENIAAKLTGRTPSARFLGHGECFIETGDGQAGFGGGDFFAEPVPLVKVRAPSWRWHLGKVLFEKLWLATRC